MRNLKGSIDLFWESCKNEVSEKYQVRPHKEYVLILSFLEPFMIYLVLFMVRKKVLTDN